jgi:drug/metabolite transporter (DMT)-like permease
LSTLSPAARAGVQMVLCTLLWAAFFVSGKLAVAEAGALAVAALRFLVAGVVLTVLLFAREADAFRLSGRDWLLALGLGATGVTLYNALTFLGLTMAPASEGAMISPSLNPVLTVFLAALWFKEPLSRNKVGGLMLAIAGLALIFGGPMLGAQMTGSRLLGDLLLLASGVAWSAYTLLGKLAAGRFSSLASTTYASVVGGVLLLPMAAQPLQAVQWGALTPAFWGHILFLALGSTVAAFMLFQNSIRLVGAANTVSYLPLIPIFGVLMGVVLLHERPTVLQMAGLAVAIAGVILANRPARQVVSASS